MKPVITCSLLSLATLVGAAGCQRRRADSSCAQVAANAASSAGAAVLAKVTEDRRADTTQQLSALMLTSCVQDRWTPASRQCLARASDAASAGMCLDQTGASAAIAAAVDRLDALLTTAPSGQDGASGGVMPPLNQPLPPPGGLSIMPSPPPESTPPTPAPGATPSAAPGATASQPVAGYVIIMPGGQQVAMPVVGGGLTEADVNALNGVTGVTATTGAAARTGNAGLVGNTGLVGDSGLVTTPGVAGATSQSTSGVPAIGTTAMTGHPGMVVVPGATGSSTASTPPSAASPGTIRNVPGPRPTSPRAH